MKLNTQFMGLVIGISLSFLEACVTTPMISSTSAPSNMQTPAPISSSVGGAHSTPTSSLIIAQSTQLALPTDTTEWVLPNNHIGQVAYSPDGEYLAILSSSGLLLYQASSMVLVGSMGQTQNIYSFAWSPDGQELATGSGDGIIRIWTVATQNEVVKWHESSEVLSMAWSPDGARLASGLLENAIHIGDVETANDLANINMDIGSGSVNSLSWSQDGKQLASGHTGRVRIWDTKTWQVISDIEDDDFYVRAIYSVAWSPDAKWLATGVQDGVLLIWNASTGQKAMTLVGHTENVISLAWSHDGKLLFSGSYDAVRIWDTSTEEQLGILDLSTKDISIYSISLSPDGKQVAVGTYEGFLILWDVTQLP